VTRKRKWVLKFLAALVVVLLALAVVAFFFPQNLLCIDSGTVKADVMVVLGGGVGERPIHAAELFDEHEAPRIIISGSGDCDINRRILLKAGVPASAIEIEGKSLTTRENALYTIKMLREEKLRRVILVTSWYHSRRALMCFEHYAPDIQFYSRPAYYFWSRSGWPKRKVEHRIYLEYPKLIGYWICYGVRPF
jgi:uncharacterized SAM-binding protein YcdF (DUF218 family)